MESERDDLEDTIREVVQDELAKQADRSVPASRRNVLAGLLGLGAGTLGTYGAVGSAAAQTGSAGYIGSESQPVEEIYANAIHADSLDELDIEGADISVASVSTERIDIDDRIYQSGDVLNSVGYFSVTSNPDDVTSSSYTSISTDLVGVFDADRIPPGATLYGRMFGRLDGEDDETMTVTFRVTTLGASDTELESIAITREGSGPSFVESGWQPITEDLGDLVYAIDAKAKITGGTGSVSGTQLRAEFEWRID